MKHEIEIGLLTPYAIEAAVDGERFVAELLVGLPSYAPERVGNWEPLRHAFDSNSIRATVAEHWKDPFLWKRGKPRIEGSVWLGSGHQHTAIHIRARALQGNAEELRAFFRRTAKLLRVDFGYFHQFSDAQIDLEADPQETVIPFRQGLSTHDLKRCIPELCWATVLGAPYIELIGEEIVSACPAAVNEQLCDRIRYVQVSASLDDVASDPKAYISKREAARRWLGADLFCGDGPSRTPVFRWYDRSPW